VECVSRARELLGDKLGDDWGLDAKWKGAQERKAQDTIVRLEANLASSRRDEGREPVRKAYLAIAQFFMERGDYSQAMTKYLECKEAASTNAHHLQSCLDIIKCSVHTGTLNHVKNQAQRALTIPDIKTDYASQALVNATLGLYNLKSGAYRPAAQNFLSISDHISKHNDIISIQDVAVYASMTALASYTRRELKQVASTDSFKRLVEQAPVWKKVINDFHANNYSAVFAVLDGLKSDLYLDMYMASHVDKLISKIRDKALMEYFKPFVSVKIPQMAESFKLPVADLERQLVSLIADGKISARIDSANKILYARHADERNGTFEKALAVGDKYIRDTKSMLLRLSLAENDLVVRHPDVERQLKKRNAEKEKGDAMMKEVMMSGNMM